MTNSTFYLITGIGGVIYSLFAGLRYYALTGSELIQPNKAKQMIKKGQINHIIDVRTQFEYNMGHYKGSVNIPITSFSRNKVKKMNKDDDILVYCNTGQRARRGAELLRSYGFQKVYYIDGTYKSLQ